MTNKIELSNTNMEHIDTIRAILVENKMEFNEASIDFVLNKLNKSFEDTIEYSDENLKIILMCGLPSHSRSEALKIMGIVRDSGISYREFHMILVKILRESHFFMDMDQRMNFMNLLAVMNQ